LGSTFIKFHALNVFIRKVVETMNIFEVIFKGRLPLHTEKWHGVKAPSNMNYQRERLHFATAMAEESRSMRFFLVATQRSRVAKSLITHNASIWFLSGAVKTFKKGRFGVEN
jgi:hypothetical protein